MENFIFYAVFYYICAAQLLEKTDFAGRMNRYLLVQLQVWKVWRGKYPNLKNN